MDHSAIDFLSKSANRKVRKLLGRAYLRENRITEALEVYQGLLAEIPDDPDVLMVLGNLYQLAGCPWAAEQLFIRVTARGAGNGQLRKQVETLKTRQPQAVHQAHMAKEMLPAHQDSLPGLEPADGAPPISGKAGETLCDEAGDPLAQAAMARLAARLHEIREPERREQIRDAADIIEKMNPEEWPTEGNGLATEEVQTLMPALIELNIREARAAGYPDLAEALQSLRLSLSRHVDDRWVEDLLRDDNVLDLNARD